MIRDPPGIAHIYASNQEDLFLAQGFVAAPFDHFSASVSASYADHEQRLRSLED